MKKDKIKEKTNLKEMLKCPICKKPFIPDEEAMKFLNKKGWDGHTWKPNCKHFPTHIRLSVG